MKKHIVLSCNTTWNLYNFRCGMIRRFITLGNRVTIVTPADDFSAKLAALGCEVIDFPMDNKGTDPLRDGLLFTRYFLLYRKLKPDFVLHFTIKPVIYGGLSAQILGIPYISNITGLGTAFLRDNWLTTLVQVLYRISQKRATCVFFQNRDDCQLFLDKGLVSESECRLLPGSGVNLTHFTSEPMPENSKDKPVFLLIARLLWDKGVGEYIEAAREIRQNRPEVRFQLLGFVGVENATAIPQATVDEWVDEGLVEYLGETDDVRPYIEKASCIVLPSYREGTPRSLLEAAAMGRPIITTDAVGCREVVEHGINGLLCRPQDADDLSSTLKEFLTYSAEKQQNMGNAGRALAEKKFDEQIVINKYVEVLNL